MEKRENSTTRAKAVCLCRHSLEGGGGGREEEDKGEGVEGEEGGRGGGHERMDRAWCGVGMLITMYLSGHLRQGIKPLIPDNTIKSFLLPSFSPTH